MADADATLFFGYRWDHFVAIDFDLDAEVKTLMAARGIHDPWDDRPHNMSYWQFEQENFEAIKTWKTARTEVMHEVGVDIGWYNDEIDMRSFVHIVGAEIVAYKDDPQPIVLPVRGWIKPALYREWQAKLDAFLAQHKVPPPEGDNQPGWWLVARDCS